MGPKGAPKHFTTGPRGSSFLPTFSIVKASSSCLTPSCLQVFSPKWSWESCRCALPPRCFPSPPSSRFLLPFSHTTNPVCSPGSLPWHFPRLIFCCVSASVPFFRDSLCFRFARQRLLRLFSIPPVALVRCFHVLSSLVVLRCLC